MPCWRPALVLVVVVLVIVHRIRTGGSGSRGRCRRTSGAAPMMSRAAFPGLREQALILGSVYAMPCRVVP